MVAAPCPICSKPVAPPAAADRGAHPFCCERCKTIDLGRWLDGAYQVPVEEPPPPDDEAPISRGRFGGRLADDSDPGD